jgi:hypothetical protein
MNKVKSDSKESQALAKARLWSESENESFFNLVHAQRILHAANPEFRRAGHRFWEDISKKYVKNGYRRTWIGCQEHWKTRGKFVIPDAEDEDGDEDYETSISSESVLKAPTTRSSNINRTNLEMLKDEDTVEEGRPAKKPRLLRSNQLLGSVRPNQEDPIAGPSVDVSILNGSNHTRLEDLKADNH